ncbi:MAG TPA: AraC family transcriptional regulator [Albitalea sp.]|nr:AraC family transcriptional regulator [Albitalea sp.]
MSERTTSGAWVTGVAQALRDAGLDARALCAEAGIDLDELAAPAARCSSAKVSQLWQLAAQRSGNPAIGLVAPHVVRPANFEVVGYAMMSSPNLYAGLERLVRYLRIISDAVTVTLSPRGDQCRVSLEILGGHQLAPRQRFEFSLLSVLTFCRWISGRDLRPLAVELTHPAPADLQPYDEAFRCPLRFDAPDNALVFARADLDLPLPTADPKLAELHDRFAGERVDQLGSAQTTYSARELIIRSLPDGEPKREDIARALHMSERTLQRRFREEGVSFQQLLDSTRRELAELYLGRRHPSLAEAAYLLGFSDQGSFNRACKRWFDVSPGQYRARVGADRRVAAVAP